MGSKEFSFLSFFLKSSFSTNVFSCDNRSVLMSLQKENLQMVWYRESVKITNHTDFKRAQNSMKLLHPLPSNFRETHFFGLKDLCQSCLLVTTALCRQESQRGSLKISQKLAPTTGFPNHRGNSQIDVSFSQEFPL